jgi:N-methylhydantoinase B/oxoprolinase/acetone carboxylase alpha subunit
VKFPPWGLFGGEAGKAARYSVLSRDGDREIPSKGTFQVKEGEVVRVETCGGGGYGPAFERDRELVLDDVREGKVHLPSLRFRLNLAGLYCCRRGLVSMPEGTFTGLPLRRHV